jgi:hypothetical protein
MGPPFAPKTQPDGQDQVVAINRLEQGEQGNRYNSTWYRVDGKGFTYSGWVQPVDTRYQMPSFSLPSSGQLGEITVPFCDTRLDPTLYSRRGYRIYYGTTHWVKAIIVVRDEKSIWYEIYDNHLHKSFYVPSHDMRLVPQEELSLLSPEVDPSQKSIHVDLGTQLVTAFEGEEMVFSSRCSSGTKGTRTPEGEFLTYHKGPSIHMTNEGDDEANIYDLPGVPGAPSSPAWAMPSTAPTGTTTTAARQPRLREPPLGGGQIPIPLDPARGPAGHGLPACPRRGDARHHRKFKFIKHTGERA